MLEEFGKLSIESNAIKHTWVPKLGRVSVDLLSVGKVCLRISWSSG